MEVCNRGLHHCTMLGTRTSRRPRMPKSCKSSRQACLTGSEHMFRERCFLERGLGASIWLAPLQWLSFAQLRWKWWLSKIYACSCLSTTSNGSGDDSEHLRQAGIYINRSILMVGEPSRVSTFTFQDLHKQITQAFPRIEASSDKPQ